MFKPQKYFIQDICYIANTVNLYLPNKSFVAGLRIQILPKNRRDRNKELDKISGNYNKLALILFDDP